MDAMDKHDRLVELRAEEEEHIRQNSHCPKRMYKERGLLTRSLDAALAKANNWRVAAHPFTLDKLVHPARWDTYMRTLEYARDAHVDHATCFRFPNRGKPVALLSHVYDAERHRLDRAAVGLGLQYTVLEWSWYFPHATLAILWTNDPAYVQPSRNLVTCMRCIVGKQVAP